MARKKRRMVSGLESGVESDRNEAKLSKKE